MVLIYSQHLVFFCVFLGGCDFLVSLYLETRTNCCYQFHLQYTVVYYVCRCDVEVGMVVVFSR